MVRFVSFQLKQQTKVAFQEGVADFNSQDGYMIGRNLIKRERLVPEIVATILERSRFCVDNLWIVTHQGTQKPMYLEAELMQQQQI